MTPYIESTSFGSISANGKTYDHDIYIDLSGKILKRKKKLSKEIYGTSHTVSEQEAKHVYEQGAEMIIIGAGQYGVLKLSSEAELFFSQKNCTVTILPTPKAAKKWNEENSKKCIALIHVTC